MEAAGRLLWTNRQTLFSCVTGDFLFWVTADFLRRIFHKETDHVAQVYVVFRTVSRISLIGMRIIDLRVIDFDQIRNDRFALNIFALLDFR